MSRQKRTKRHMWQRIQQDQRGFSLVELIVTLAIVGIVSVGGLYSISVVTGQNIKSCAKKLESAINETRVFALSKSQAKMELYTNADGVFVKVYADASATGTEEKIGKTGISIKYEDTAGNEVELNSGTTLTISFDRSSGAFRPLTGSTDKYCEAVILEEGSRKYTLRMIPQTGKFYLE